MGTTPTSIWATAKPVMETTPRDNTSSFFPTVAVKWFPTTSMVTPVTLLTSSTKEKPNTTNSTNLLTNPPTNPPTNPNTTPLTNPPTSPPTSLNTRHYRRNIA